MDNPIYNQTTISKNDDKFMWEVFSYFGLGLIVSSLWAYAWLPLLNLFWGQIQTMLIVVIVLKIGLVLTSGMWSKQKGLWSALFFVYTFLWGLTLMPILALALTSQSAMIIAVQSLLSAAGLFLLMWFYGHSTKTDLTKAGTIAFFAMIAVFVAAIVNLFMNSWVLGLIVSSLSIIIFSVFTAYDIQKIKEGMYESSILAALNLYIDFIALFRSIFHLLYSFSNKD